MASQEFQYHDSGKFDCQYLMVCPLWRHLLRVCLVLSGVFCRIMSGEQSSA